MTKPTVHIVSVVGLVLALVNATPRLYAQEQDQADDSVSHKSPSLAFALSAVATAVPVALSTLDKIDDHTGGALAAGGLLIGPSVGFMYGGAWGRAFTGMGIRLGTALLTLGIGLATAEGGDGSGAVWVGLLGGAVVLADVFVDLIAVGPYISKMNDMEDARRQGLSFNLVPVYNPETKSMGVHLNLSF